MEKHEYRTMFQLEDHYWWYNGLRHLILTLLARESADAKVRLLDAGCGTGGVLQAIQERFAISGFGFDFAAEGLVHCRQRGLSRLARASINEMPYGAGPFDVILSLDVLCHRSIKDDREILRTFASMLRPGGLLILNLPAYDWLKSSHDVAVHTAHRFGRGEMRKKLLAAGFSKVRLSYRNTFLFPALAAVRLLRKNEAQRLSQEQSDLTELPPLINGFLSRLLYMENRLMRYVNLPFGLSLLCLAWKEEAVQ